MCKEGVTGNVISFNAAISACEKGGQWQRALLLLDDMCMAGVTMDVISFSASESAKEDHVATMDAESSTEYSPGTPGAPWTKDEMLVVKAKLCHVMSLTKVETGNLYRSLQRPHGIDMAH